MDLLTAILTCSLYVDDQLVVAMAQANSQGNAYAVVDAHLDLSDAPASPPPRSREGAQARLTQLESNGGVPLVGLLPVPPAWASAFGRSVSDLLDGCTNIAIGTAMLSNFAQQCATDANPRSDRARGLAMKRSADARPSRRRKSRALVNPSQERRQCVLRKYGEAVDFVGLYEFVSLELSFQQRRALFPSFAARAQESPIFPELGVELGSTWGPDRIFVSAPVYEDHRQRDLKETMAP
jgi:hypothetical protein